MLVALDEGVPVHDDSIRTGSAFCHLGDRKIVVSVMGRGGRVRCLVLVVIVIVSSSVARISAFVATAIQFSRVVWSLASRAKHGNTHRLSSLRINWTFDWN